MTDSHSSELPNKKEPLSLKREQARDQLIIETGDDEWDNDEEIILSSNQEGGSLTLLEEYSMRKTKTSKLRTFIALACAAVSLTFAYLTYQTL